MKKQRMISLLLAGIFCAGLVSGCDSPQRPKHDATESIADGPVTAYAVDMTSNENITTIHSNHEVFNNEQYFLEYYNDNSGQTPVEVTLFPDAESMNKQLATELLSGGGPDLFVFQDSTMPQYRSYANQGVFADLNPYLEKSGYQSDQFQQKIFDYGTFDGKRRYIPLEYGVPVAVTTQSIAEAYGLEEIGAQLNYRNYFDLLSPTDAFETDIGNGYNMFWFSEIESFRYRIATSFLDEENKCGEFVSDNFKNSIEQYVRLIQGQKGHNGFYTALGNTRLSVVTDEYALFLNQPLMSDNYLNTISDDMWGLKEHQNETVLIYPIKEYNGEDFCAYIGKMMAVNNNSPRKDKAWEVINYAISPAMQETMTRFKSYNNSPITGNPVSLQGQQSNRDEWLHSGTVPEVREVRTALIEKYYEILSSVTVCDTLTHNSQYMEEVFDPYYFSYEQGKITLDKFTSELQNKTGIYLKETL